jgi:hypothetical protein
MSWLAILDLDLNVCHPILSAIVVEQVGFSLASLAAIVELVAGALAHDNHGLTLGARQQEIPHLERSALFRSHRASLNPSPRTLTTPQIGAI